MYMSDFCPKEYGIMVNALADEEKYFMPIRALRERFREVYPVMLRCAATDDERAFVNECKERIICCYGRALEKNYKRIAQHRAEGSKSFRTVDSWTLTLDASGTPCQATVVDIDKDGAPVYANGCTATDVKDECIAVGNARYELRNLLMQNYNYYELREAAHSLIERGRLGIESTPSVDYSRSGLTREQSDAQAWKNYAIESGAYNPVDYDEALQKLLAGVDACIDFYEKALSAIAPPVCADTDK